MDHLDDLKQQLNAANVSDDMISRGVRLTSRGTQKLMRRFNCSEDDLKTMFKALSARTKPEVAPTGLPSSPDIFEKDERFTYEADMLGNVTLCDSKTGATKFLQGSDGAKLLREIERNHPNFQGVIAPYFSENTLMEFAQSDDGDDGRNGGTYNFPYKGKFACARFWMAGNKPQIRIVGVVDAEGNEVALDDIAMADATKVAWEWVDKV